MKRAWPEWRAFILRLDGRPKRQSSWVISASFHPFVFSDDTEMAKKWLGRDIFAQAGIQSAVDKGKQEQRLTMLHRQYRMHPEIMRVTNSIFYNGRLTDNLGAEVSRTSVRHWRGHLLRGVLSLFTTCPPPTLGAADWSREGVTTSIAPCFQRN